VCYFAGEQLFDNNEGKDYTYVTAAGGTWEEWQAQALERQAEQEKERYAAEEVRYLLFIVIFSYSNSDGGRA
jgi:hypothetical protein